MWTKAKEAAINDQRKALAKAEKERDETVDALVLALRGMYVTRFNGQPQAPQAPQAPAFPPPSAPLSWDGYRAAADELVANADTIRDLLEPFDSGVRAVPPKAPQ